MQIRVLHAVFEVTVVDVHQGLRDDLTNDGARDEGAKLIVSAVQSEDRICVAEDGFDVAAAACSHHQDGRVTVARDTGKETVRKANPHKKPQGVLAPGDASKARRETRK